MSCGCPQKKGPGWGIVEGPPQLDRETRVELFLLAVLVVTLVVLDIAVLIVAITGAPW